MATLFKPRTDGGPRELTEQTKISVYVGTAATILLSTWGAAWYLATQVAKQSEESREEKTELRTMEKAITTLSGIVEYHHATDWTLREQIAYIKEMRVMNPEARIFFPDPIEVSRETHVVKDNMP